MDALNLILLATFFAFLAGYTYASGERLAGVGILAFGVGTALIRNPFPTAGGDLYVAAAVVLTLGGLLLFTGVPVVRFLQRKSAPQNTSS